MNGLIVALTVVLRLALVCRWLRKQFEVMDRNREGRWVTLRERPITAAADGRLSQAQKADTDGASVSAS